MLRLARTTQAGNRCDEFGIIIAELGKRAVVYVTLEGTFGDQITTDSNPTAIFGPRGAEEFSKLTREGCPRATPRPARVYDRIFLRDRWQLFVGVGGGSFNVPQVNGGTQLVPGGEVPIANSAGTLTGAGVGFFATIPLNTSLADLFYLSAGGSVLDGSGSGTVPIGGNPVAFTHLFPLPGGSTGVFAGATGQDVQIITNGHVVDFSAGIKDVTPVLVSPPPGPPSVPQIFPPDHQLDLHTAIGVRFRNVYVRHMVDQQSLTFPDLNSQKVLDQSSHFVGAQFGLGLITAPPGSEPGFVGSVHAFVAAGGLFTSATATESSRCGPCGPASPEFDVNLSRSFTDTKFSVIVGGTVQVGYRFDQNNTLFLKGTVDHMTGVPFINVPTTPTQQPVNLGHGAVTGATITVGARIRFR